MDHNLLGEDPTATGQMFWRGFYYMAPSGGTGIVNGVKFTQNEPFSYSFDLMTLNPKPKTIEFVSLEGAGWIIRRPNAIDGRGVRIEASGFERLTDIYRDGNRRLDEIDACLTAEQASIVLDYLQTVTNAVRAASLGLVSRCESDWPVRPPIE